MAGTWHKYLFCTHPLQPSMHIEQQRQSSQMKSGMAWKHEGAEPASPAMKCIMAECAAAEVGRLFSRPTSSP